MNIHSNIIEKISIIDYNFLIPIKITIMEGMYYGSTFRGH